MGNIECCEGTDQQMRVSINEGGLLMLDNPNKFPQLMTEFQMFNNKAKQFGDMFLKRAEGSYEFILQVFLSSKGSEVVSVPMKIYSDAVEHAEQKKMLRLDTPINDPNQTHEQFFIGQQSNNRYLLKIIPFGRFEQEQFKRIVYEIFMHRKISAYKCPTLHTIYTEYVIESGIDKEANDKCCVVVAQHGMATLHEIVTYRKQTNWSWTESQFTGLMYSMVQALSTLHSKKVAHRDIRPHNILYSGYKSTYLLTGFRNSKTILGKPNETHSIVGVPFYASSELKSHMKDGAIAEFAAYNCFEADIYALGMTLSTAFFMQLTLPPSMILPALIKYEKRYPFLQLIATMIRPNPPSIGSLVQAMPFAAPRQLSQQNLIQTLRYKSKPQDEQFVSHRKAIADGYYHMFMYGHWAVEINEVVSYYELKKDKVQLAQVYKQMGDIYSQHHQQPSIEQYYGKAATMFSDIGSDCIHEKRVEQGIKYLEKGIECNRKAYRGIENYSLALLLNRLAMAHHQKSQYEVAKAFQEQALEMTGKTKSTNSLEYAHMALDAAKIESEFLNLKQADIQLKASLKIIETRQQDDETLKLKAMVLEALGNNYRMKAIERKHKAAEYREKAEHCILDALEICERLKGNGDIQIAGILMSLGNVYFDKRDFHNAKKTYDRSLIIKKNVLPPDSIEIGETLTNLANCYKSLREYNQAIAHYDQAIQVFRASYGNDHNHNTAVAIGNIGLVYKDISRLKEAKQYIELAKKILRDLYGEECPDYQYFHQQI